MIVIRLLEDGEQPDPSLKRAVIRAEPCDRFPSVAEAKEQAAKTLASRLRELAAGRIPVVVQLG